MKTKSNPITRRHFLKGAGLGVAAFSVVPAHVLGLKADTSPNGKLNMAFVGVGGRGGANLSGLKSENTVALCDLDERRAGRTFEQYPKARKFRDFRKMFETVDREIDAVAISTPDHTHAVACMDAIRRGKHIYCEKPLAHSIHEVRTLMKAARDHKVVTQLGNQGHSFRDIRVFCEWIWDGAIGDVSEIHAGCSANNSQLGQLPLLKERHAVPPELDWDLWLGPAQYRPYHPVYVPGKWRAWTPFGSGTIGDWTCHVVDPVFWALDLGSPKSIQAKAKNYDPKKHGDTFPAGTIGAHLSFFVWGSASWL